MKTVTQGTGSLGRDTNRLPPEYEQTESPSGEPARLLYSILNISDDGWRAKINMTYYFGRCPWTRAS
jgi:hypothetical protein